MNNIRRQNEVSRVRVNRIITEYVQFKHPEIYAKAKEFYTKLDTLYPRKKDLRRTYEFQSFITGSKDNKYKYTRKSQDEISDNMLLEIQLMDKSAVPTVAPAVVPTVAPAVVPTVVPAVGAEITLPVVADEIIDEIIKSLSQDPDVSTCFDEILTDGETPLEMELTASGF